MDPVTNRNEKDAQSWQAGVPSDKSLLSKWGGYLYSSTKAGNIQDSFTPSKEALIKGNAGIQKSAGSLGNTTKSVSTFRYRKYELQRFVIQALAGMNMRVDNCLKAVKPEIHLLKDASGHVHAGGLMLCGSVWVCPVCASRISEVRRQELTRALQGSGLFTVMVTVTLQHDKGDSLGDLIDALNTSLRKMKQGRAWKAFETKYGIKASVSSLEVTYSRARGWHPHKHILYFLEGGNVDLDAFRQELSDRYVKLVEKCGRYASKYHAIDVKAGNEEAGSYVSKWGIVSEVTGSNTKEARQEGGLSMWALAEMAHTEAWARQGFREYAKATFGKRALVYSRGAREVLGIGEEEEGEGESEVIQETIAVVSRDLWNKVHRLGLVGDLFQVTEAGGVIALNTFLGEVQGAGVGSSP